MCTIQHQKRFGFSGFDRGTIYSCEKGMRFAPKQEDFYEYLEEQDFFKKSRFQLSNLLLGFHLPRSSYFTFPRRMDCQGDTGRDIFARVSPKSSLITWGIKGTI